MKIAAAIVGCLLLLLGAFLLIEGTTSASGRDKSTPATGGGWTCSRAGEGQRCEWQPGFDPAFVIVDAAHSLTQTISGAALTISGALLIGAATVRTRQTPAPARVPPTPVQGMHWPPAGGPPRRN